MKNTLLISLIIITLTSINCLGQRIRNYRNCEIIQGDTVNCKTADGIKYGHWIHYSTARTIHCEGCDKYLGHLVAEGMYKDNRKTGEWKFYSESNNRHPSYVAQTIWYDENEFKDSVENRYDKDGVLISRLFWEMGRLDSTQVFYKTGINKCRIYYNHGILESFNMYYPDGNLMYEGKDIEHDQIRDLSAYNPLGMEVTPNSNDLFLIFLVNDLTEYVGPPSPLDSSL